MKSIKLYAVIIEDKVPKAILVFLEGYLHKNENFSFVFAASVEPGIHFVEIGLCLCRKHEGPPWKVQIPVSCVLAILDVSEPTSGPGFFRETR